MKSLEKKEWKSFCLTDIFPEIERGKRLKSADHVEGTMPYVSSSAENNGVADFISNEQGVRKFSHCISFANSGSVGSAFYEPFSFVASDHITHLKNSNFNQDTYVFISTMLSKIAEKYSFNREIKDTRISREKVLFPVTDEGEPDYEYMAEYVCQKRNSLLSKYRKYVFDRLVDLGNFIEIPALDEKTWEPFAITDLFDFFEAGKGKGLNHLEKTNSINGIPYIGATNRNNGVLCYIKKNRESEKLIQSGNCIGFIKNGDGSAGYAIYKSEDFISTSDLIYGYANWLNKYTGLFFVAAQDMIENKYSHGYKRNMKHLSGDRVMLPVNETDDPDYKYMEQYAKNMMISKYHQYLDYMDKL